MKRRDFLTRASSLAGIGLAIPSHFKGTIQSMINTSSQGKIMTVTGPIAPENAGLMLPHEHLMSTFGEPLAIHPSYDESKVKDQVLPYLRKVKSAGCNTIADCTASYFGRDPVLLQKLSQKSDINLITNTGYYGAADDRYIPDHAYRSYANELANGWISECEQGINGTGIKPGFIKTGVDKGKLSPIDHKLVEAAAITHLQTGLTIAVHTSNNPGAVEEQLAILQEKGVHPSAWIWVHANNVEQPEDLLTAAKAGGWIELDGIQPDTLDRHLEFIKFMEKNGHLEQVLLSHDGDSYPAGGEIRPYTALMEAFIPQLRQEGFSEEMINRLTIHNPAAAFTIGVRKI